MPQTIWKGAISFGLVSIPVRVFSATEERGVSLRQVHVADGGRIRYKRFCEIDGEEVAYSDIAKGYDLGGGEMVVLTDEDMDSLPLPSTKAVDVLQFVPAEQYDPIATAKSYYLQADQLGEKPYVLLRDALRATGKVAIVKVALRSRESLAAIRPYGDLLLLQLMLWPEEIRDAKGLAPGEGVNVKDAEVKMAEAYIDTLTGDFDADEYTDHYAAALKAVVDAKVAGREVVTLDDDAEPAAEVVDLMEALRQSVARAKERRAADGDAAPAEKPAAKKAPAKKAAAKKTAAKKTAAEKVAAEPEEKPAAKKTAAKKAPAKKAAAKKSA
ncbi:Ku protein [Sporichthya sp.]|uniref:non-homologous end joining protein Ku n=1 Tax=Sporichthya sp. TaxID=65475 RepID=UPI00182DD6BA|nr:Ku protein [Sporichthya sp.]MBA3744939.1 Ku protein [Sporichthya sp.]